MSAACPLHPAQRTNAEGNLNVCVGPKADIAATAVVGQLTPTPRNAMGRRTVSLVGGDANSVCNIILQPIGPSFGKVDLSLYFQSRARTQLFIEIF